MAPISGRKGLVKASGAAVAFTNEATTANVARTQYQITAAAKRVWDRAATITVENDVAGNAVYSASTNYTINRLSGIVTFGSPLAAGTNVRVSGSYLPMTTLAEAKAFTVTVSREQMEDSEFGDTDITRVAGMPSIRGSLGRWHDTATTLRDSLLNATGVVVELYVDSALDPALRAWAQVSQEGVEAVVAGLIDQSVEWEGLIDADKRSHTRIFTI